MSRPLFFLHVIAVAAVVTFSAARSYESPITAPGSFGILAVDAPALDKAEATAHREWGSSIASFA